MEVLNPRLATLLLLLPAGGAGCLVETTICGPERPCLPGAQCVGGVCVIAIDVGPLDDDDSGDDDSSDDDDSGGA